MRVAQEHGSAPPVPVFYCGCQKDVIPRFFGFSKKLNKTRTARLYAALRASRRLVFRKWSVLHLFGNHFNRKEIVVANENIRQGSGVFICYAPRDIPTHGGLVLF